MTDCFHLPGTSVSIYDKLSRNSSGVTMWSTVRLVKWSGTKSGDWERSWPLEQNFGNFIPILPDVRVHERSTTSDIGTKQSISNKTHFLKWNHNAIPQAISEIEHRNRISWQICRTTFAAAQRDKLVYDKMKDSKKDLIFLTYRITISEWANPVIIGQIVLDSPIVGGFKILVQVILSSTVQWRMKKVTPEWSLQPIGGATETLWIIWLSLLRTRSKYDGSGMVLETYGTKLCEEDKPWNSFDMGY